MSWVYLFIAGLLEIGWPFGFKMSQVAEKHRMLWLVFGIISMALSGVFLWMAQKNIPMGTAYAIWTGIGASGAFLLGILYFGDALTAFRLVAFSFILIGIVGLKIAG